MNLESDKKKAWTGAFSAANVIENDKARSTIAADIAKRLFEVSGSEEMRNKVKEIYIIFNKLLTDNSNTFFTAEIEAI